MDWLLSLDSALFRLANNALANSACDWLMPQLSGHRLFVPALLVVAILFCWRGGARARLFVFFALLAVVLAVVTPRLRLP